MTEGLYGELARILSGDVHTDDETLQTYSTDTSLFTVQPQVVVSPRTVRDVCTLVSYADTHGTTLTGRSAGTGMDGGALSEGVVVDFGTYFKTIGTITADADGTTGHVSVQPGVFYRDFEKETLKRNFLMPSYPASRELCMVGGMTANNAGGELTLRYGKVENYVEQVKVVLSDGHEYTLAPLSHDALQKKLLQRDFEGDIYRQMYALVTGSQDIIQKARPKVSKNSAGYCLWNVYNREHDTFDLSKLFVGSQGTLGLITETTFRLIRPSKHSVMVIMFLDSLETIGTYVATTLTHKPTTFESYDDKTLKLALRFFWEFIKRLGVRNIFILLFNSLGEGWSMICHGIPKLVLQVTFDGDDESVLLSQAQQLVHDISPLSPRYSEVVSSSKEMAEYWLIRRESFNLLRHKVQGMKTAPFIDDIVVPPDVLTDFFPKLYAILEEYKQYMIHNIAGHIGNGNFHIIPLMDLTNEKARAIIPELSRRVYDLVLSYGGSITGEHNDGIIRTPFLKQQFGDDMYALFEKTKKIFDPKGIFNPGKKVPSTRAGQPTGTLGYAMTHIKKG
ncbi:MAG: FAD-binding oxidoreductase [Candidatus Campbellbacteria bacterium]|nr:FAD-binding oxidoreductase [Candidatus Campbellbacteria bacterium]